MDSRILKLALKQRGREIERLENRLLSCDNQHERRKLESRIQELKERQKHGFTKLAIRERPSYSFVAGGILH